MCFAFFGDYLFIFTCLFNALQLKNLFSMKPILLIWNANLTGEIIMKITDVKTYVVANPPPHHGGPYFVFLKLTTDDNVVGYGEVYV